MGNHYDVIVVGLGAMGSATCYHLAGRKAKVLGLEKFDLPHAQGSSHGYSRHTKTAVYVDTPFEPFIGRSFELWRLLEGETGQQILVTTGYLRMANTGTWDHLQGRVRHEVLNAGELAYRYPQFTLADDYHGLYDPNGGLLRPELGIASHLIEAMRRGAEIRGREAVTGWKETPECVEVETDRGRYSADQVVFTSGSWTAPLITDLGVSLTVSRQPLAWVWPARNPASFDVGSLPIWQIPAPEEDGEYYGFPMMPDHPGFKLALHNYGETSDPDQLDRGARPDDEEVVRKCLRRYIPDADGPLTAMRICMYTSTEDYLPVLDRHPARDRVTVGCGFSGGGFKFSCAFGEWLAETALGQPTTIDNEAFRFSRLLKSANTA